MRFRPRSVRLRLTLWYAGALAAMILIFSTGVYFFVRATLLREVEHQLEKELAAVAYLLTEEPDEMEELEEYDPNRMYCITEGDRSVHRSESWRRATLPAVFENLEPGPLGTWVSPKEHSYFVKTGESCIDGRTYRIGAAQDGETVKGSLKALAVTLAVGLPLAIALAIAGGYLLAGRMLSPVAAMAAKAKKITAERLS